LVLLRQPGHHDLACDATPLELTAAVNSIVLPSDPSAGTFPANSALRRTLIAILFSSTMILSMSARISLARSAEAPRSALARRAARPSNLWIWSPAMSVMAKVSRNLAGVMSASIRMLMTQSSMSRAAKRQLCRSSSAASVTGGAET
jgi:hypothetical protein